MKLSCHLRKPWDSIFHLAERDASYIPFDPGSDLHQVAEFTSI